MAESQVPFAYQESGYNIIKNLSQARFAPYLKNAGHNIDYAFALYLYNARLAKAFQFPLHILEVTLRNRVNDIFCQDFSPNWCHDICLRNALSAESLAVLDKGIQRAKSPYTEDIVATLTFDFWSNLFRIEYDRPLWQIRMKELLPYKDTSRRVFQKVVKNLNEFRNRIAHHEPIYKLNLSQIHAELLETLSWLSLDAFNWVKHYSTVNECLRSKPTPRTNGFPCLIHRCDSDFQKRFSCEKIDRISGSKFTLCISKTDSEMAVVELHHLAKFIMAKSDDDCLIIDLKAHTLGDVVRHCNIQNNFLICGAYENLMTVHKYFKSKVEYLVVYDSERAVGVIAKAHRRY